MMLLIIERICHDLYVQNLLEALKMFLCFASFGKLVKELFKRLCCKLNVVKVDYLISEFLR